MKTRNQSARRQRGLLRSPGLWIAGCMAVTLTVLGQDAAANDAFSDSRFVLGSPVTAEASNAAATLEAGEPVHAGVAAGKTLWWSWQAPYSSGVVRATTAGSTVDTVLGVYRGSSLDSLVTVTANDDEVEGTPTSTAIFRVYSGQVYHFAVGAKDTGGGVPSGSIRLKIEFFENPEGPEWTVSTLDDGTIRSSDLQGEVVVFSFFLTTCPHCQAESVEFNELHTEYADQGLRIVAVAVDFDAADLLPGFLDTFGILYPTALSNAEVQSSFGDLTNVPTTILIDRENRVVAKQVGLASKEAFETVIVPMLEHAPPPRLLLGQEGGQLTLRWPMARGRFQLQSTATPVAGNWQSSESAVDQGTAADSVTLAPEHPHRLFRLHQP